MNKENPPLNIDNVETFEDAREISKTATKESKLKEMLEQASEEVSPTGEILAEHKEKIDELKRSILIEQSTQNPDHLINKALASKNDGSESFIDERLPEEKQESKKVTGLKKLGLALGFLFAGLSGQAQGTKAEKIDGGLKKAGISRSIEDSSKKEMVTDQLRQHWNSYLDWLKSLDLQGNPALDKNGLGNAMLERYIKEHPGTSLSKESIPKIQEEFVKLREYIKHQVKIGKAEYAPGTTENNLLSHLSKVDEIPGQFTTSVKFPISTMRTIDKTTLDYASINRKASGSKDLLDGKINDVTVRDGKVTKIEKTFTKAN
jgi:hypothetical protein